MKVNLQVIISALAMICPFTVVYSGLSAGSHAYGIDSLGHSLGSSSANKRHHLGPRCQTRIGFQPGSFVEGRSPGSRWTTLVTGEEAHPLLNLLEAYAENRPATGNHWTTVNNKSMMPPVVSMLFLGDSVDWRMMSHICNRFLKGAIMPVEARGYPQRRDSFTYCETSKRIKMGALYLPGVHPTGPYAWQTVKGNDQHRLNETVRLFRLAHGGL